MTINSSDNNKKSKLIQLKSAIEEGIQNGRSEDFNQEEHLLMLKAKKSLEKMNEIPPSSE